MYSRWAANTIRDMQESTLYESVELGSAGANEHRIGARGGGRDLEGRG